MQKRRHEITIIFTVNDEPVPGKFHDPQDFVNNVCEHIYSSLQSYKPEITHVELEESTE